MRPVSDRWADGIAQSQTVLSRARLLDHQGTGEPLDLPQILGGSVTLDSRAASRGRLDVTFVSDEELELVPDDPGDPLAPYGNELQIERGIRYWDGGEELVTLGVFRIDEVTSDSTDAGIITQVTGLDRSARVIDARFEEPFSSDALYAGNTIVEFITSELLSVDPNAVIHAAVTSALVPSVFKEEAEDRWAMLQSAAIGIGMELFYDSDGYALLRPVPDPTTGPVASLVEGENGVLLRAAKKWTRVGAYNRAISSGENLAVEAPPIRGVATDDNPLSPTYYYGPFGKVPTFHQSAFITTTTQAQDSANAILNKQKGTSRQIEFGSIVNPALEPSDVVRITRNDLGVDEDHVIDSITIPLDAAGEAAGATRSVLVY